MDLLALSRWQFALTTIYHFFFVPLTLGLAWFVVIFETIYVRTGNETYKRLAKFWGKLFVINYAMGVVTGIVQEFQFGMNWSEYSRYVGDIFGVPLAIEGLLAFFLEFDPPGRVDLRLGSPLKRCACPGDLAGSHRLKPFGGLDPDRQRFHAAPGRLCAQ